jgi:hypothetical protein
MGKHRASPKPEGNIMINFEYIIKERVRIDKKLEELHKEYSRTEDADLLSKITNKIQYLKNQALSLHDKLYSVN